MVLVLTTWCFYLQNGVKFNLGLNSGSGGTVDGKSANVGQHNVEDTNCPAEEFRTEDAMNFLCFVVK